MCLHQILMVRDGLTAEQAANRINDASRRIAQKTASYEILRDEFNVNPEDYWLEIAPDSAVRWLHD